MRINISLTVDIDPERWAIAHRIPNRPELVRESVRWSVRRAAAGVTGVEVIRINNSGRLSSQTPRS